MENHIYPLPDKFLSRLNDIIPKELLSDVLASFSQRRPCTFRSNTIKIPSDQLQMELEKQDIRIQRIPWYHDGFRLEDVAQRILMQTHWYTEGKLYIQGLSSMIPALVLDPKFNENVLDIAAAPGSKTTQMAALMQNSGEIVANDKSRVRIYKLRYNLQLQGVINTKVIQFPGQILWKKLPAYFDKVLVDVPCSMEGRIFTGDLKTYRDWSTKKIEYLAAVQKYLLRSAIACAKPGGTIVYSTCTLAPEENESIIDWILQKEEGKLSVENISLADFHFASPLPSWKQKIFSTEIKKTVRILPSHTYEGFYLAKLRKLA